jgi:hypothetical protein
MMPGRPTARKAQLPSGHRMTQEANAGSRKATGNRDVWPAPPLAVSYNRPDTGSARARKGADVGQVGLCGLDDISAETEGQVGRRDDTIN